VCVCVWMRMCMCVWESVCVCVWVCLVFSWRMKLSNILLSISSMNENVIWWDTRGQKWDWEANVKFGQTSTKKKIQNKQKCKQTKHLQKNELKAFYCLDLNLKKHSLFWHFVSRVWPFLKNKQLFSSFIYFFLSSTTLSRLVLNQHMADHFLTDLRDWEQMLLLLIFNEDPSPSSSSRHIILNSVTIPVNLTTIPPPLCFVLFFHLFNIWFEANAH